MTKIQQNNDCLKETRKHTRLNIPTPKCTPLSKWIFSSPSFHVRFFSMWTFCLHSTTLHEHVLSQAQCLSTTCTQCRDMDKQKLHQYGLVYLLTQHSPPPLMPSISHQKLAFSLTNAVF